MSNEAVSEATVVKADGMLTGTWGNDSVLALVFQLEDGRTTQATYIPGQWQISNFLEMVDVSSVELLVGTHLRVVLSDPSATVPAVTELLPSGIPSIFHEAFDDNPNHPGE